MSLECIFAHELWLVYFWFRTKRHSAGHDVLVVTLSISHSVDFMGHVSEKNHGQDAIVNKV